MEVESYAAIDFAWACCSVTAMQISDDLRYGGNSGRDLPVGSTIADTTASPPCALRYTHRSDVEFAWQSSSSIVAHRMSIPVVRTEHALELRRQMDGEA